MEEIITLINSIVLPVITVLLGYFGWRANAERNRLKAEIKGMEASNITKEIENQNGWIDLYKKLADDQATRITQAMDKIQQLEKTINDFQNAFNKANTCLYSGDCPVRIFLQNKQGKPSKNTTGQPSNTRSKNGNIYTGSNEPGRTENSSGTDS